MKQAAIYAAREVQAIREGRERIIQAYGEERYRQTLEEYREKAEAALRRWKPEPTVPDRQEIYEAAKNHNGGK